MQDEEMALVLCDDCNTEFPIIGNRGFRYSEDGYLCFDCALRRGGTYDGQHETWIDMPNIEDLPDARRPHA